MVKRDDFSPKVKRALADRVGTKCSRPGCEAPTCGPHTEPAKAVNLGVAAHITAAAPGGPRYDASLSPAERGSATNGIWLCQVCAKLIDSDPLKFPVGLLREWKRTAEEHADQEVGRARSILPVDIAGLDHKVSALHAIAQSPPRPSADQIDGELDEVKQELDKHDPAMARRLVERVVLRHGDRLTDRQQWRAKTQLATTYLAEGELAKGAGLLLEAVRLQPAEEKARTNEAVAYELLEDRPKAHELAALLKRDLPHSGTALAIWVRTAPDAVFTEELEREASVVAGGDGEVCIALADRLSGRGDISRAESYARTAANLQPAWPHAWLMLAQVLHRKAGDEVTVATRNETLQESADRYGRAIVLATAQQDKRVAHLALVNRGLVREATEQYDLAADDYRQAIQLLPNHPEAVDRYATFLARRSRHDEAVEQARRASELAPRGRHEFLYAATLYDRNTGDDRQRAVEIWRRLVTEGSEEVWDRAADCAVLGLCALERHADAKTFLADAAMERVARPVRYLCEARVRLAAQDRDAAVSRARDAAAAVGADAALTTRLSISHLLVSLELDAEVIPLLTPVARRGAFDIVTRWLLDCAQRTENHGLFLRLCAELREAGVRDDTLRRHEFEILAQYDPPAAASLAQAYLAENPGDRLARLRLTFIGLQCERQEWITTSLDELPEPSASRPGTIGRMVLAVLHHEGCGLQALRFGYGLLRAYPSDPDAHHAYITLFILFDTSDWPLTADAVARDTAVCVREVGKEAVEWLVVEADRPNESVGEYAPDHSRITPLLNLGVGSQFVLAPGVQPRMGEVVAVRSKYLYRFEQTRDAYQSRFHDRHDFQVVEVVKRAPDGTEQVDLSPIFADENRRREYVDGIVQLYKTRPTPINMFADFIGRDMFETMDALQTPELGVRCWNGADDEWARAAEELSKASTIVLDVTALFTLGRLGLLSRSVPRRGIKFAVSYGTFAHVRELADENKRCRGRAHWVSDGAGGYAFHEIPEEVLRQEREFRVEVERWVRQNCELVPCRELSEVPVERRERLVERFGRDGAESACLAMRPEHILWTDDFTLGVIAREWLPGVRHTWTQPSLRCAADIGVLTEQEYSIATATLIGRGYTSLRVDSAVIAAAAAQTSWSPTEWPLARALELFRDRKLGEGTRLTIAARFILRLFYHTRCLASRRTVVFSLLEHIRSRRVAEELLRVLPGIFIGDAMNSFSARSLVRSWLRRTNGPR